MSDTPLTEKQIEQRVCDYAKARGWMTPKWSSPNYRGVPDRLFLKKGQWVAIEFKRKGGKLTALQERVHQHLAEHDAHVAVVDSVEKGKLLVDSYDRLLAGVEARIDRELADERRPSLVSTEGKPLQSE